MESTRRNDWWTRHRIIIRPQQSQFKLTPDAGARFRFTNHGRVEYCDC